MQLDLKEIVNSAGVAIELKPDKRYLVFVDPQIVDVESLEQIPWDDTMPDVQFIFAWPPRGKTLAESVAVFELAP